MATASKPTKLKLNKTTVEAIEPPDKGYALVWDSEQSAFGLRITASGVRSYIVETRVSGKTRRVTLGKHGKLTADDARRNAKSVISSMTLGTDVTAEKRREKTLGVTLGQVVTAYKKNRVTRSGEPLKARTKADIDRHLEKNLSEWKDKPITAIRRDMVLAKYEALKESSIAQANQCMRVLGALINYASERYRTPDDERIIVDNPTHVLKRTKTLQAVKPRKTMVPLDRLGEYWSELQNLRTDPALLDSGRTAADMAALLMLTGIRLGEATTLKWSSVDLDAASMHLADTKNRTSVTLPLSDQAVEILRSRQSDAEYVFTGRYGRGYMKNCRTQLQALKRKTGIEVSPHDLRRTFRAVAAACNVELWRTKALMNHKQNQDITLSAYTDLSDVRNLKPEADRIGEYFEKQRVIFDAGNVVNLEERRA